MPTTRNRRLVRYMRQNGFKQAREIDGRMAIEDLAAAGLITPRQRRRVRKKILSQAKQEARVVIADRDRRLEAMGGTS